MKKIIFLLFLASCINNFDNNYVCVNKEFDLQVVLKNIGRVENKKLSNQIINETGFLYNPNSDKILIVSTRSGRKNSFLSDENIKSMENVELITKYTIVEKSSKKILDSGQIRVIDTSNISENNRFANYSTNNYVYDTLFYNLSRQLKNRTDLFLRKCLK